MVHFMQNFKKKICACLSSLLAITFCLSLPMGVSAETGTLGTQTPQLIANYYTVQADESLRLVDGNALTSGSYVMELVVSDLASISQFELTASYDSDILAFDSITVLPNDASGFDAINSQIINRNLIVGFISVNAGSCTALTDGTAVIFTAEITITADSAVNMYDGDDAVITVDPNPNLTFIEADYGDIRYDSETGARIYDCYGIGDAATYNYTGTVYPMEIDLSPAVGYTVSAYVGYLASRDATAGTLGNTSKGRQLSGVTITITTDSGDITATSDENGQFTLEMVPDGTYTATVAYDYGLPRTFIIVVDGADVISDTVIGIVNCNAYNNNGRDGNINSRDTSAIKAQNGKTKARNAAIYAQYYYLDVNGDGNINARDSAISKAFSGISTRTWSGNKPEQTIQNSN